MPLRVEGFPAVETAAAMIEININDPGKIINISKGGFRHGFDAGVK